MVIFFFGPINKEMIKRGERKRKDENFLYNFDILLSNSSECTCSALKTLLKKGSSTGMYEK